MEMATYDDLIEEIADLSVEMMDLHENIIDLIQAANQMKRVMVLATGASVFWAGMYVREFFKNKKVIVVNRQDEVTVITNAVNTEKGGI